MGTDICVMQGRLLAVKPDRALEENKVERPVGALQNCDLVSLFRQSTALLYKQLVSTARSFDQFVPMTD